MISYEITLSDPHAHLINVKMHLDSPTSQGEKVFMPAWCPGSYTLRDFAKHIVRIKAYGFGDPNHKVPIAKIDSHTYECDPFQGKLTIEYEVFAWDRSVRGCHFDQTHCFINGSALFLCPLLGKHQPSKVTIEAQPWMPKAFQLMTSADKVQVDERGFGVYEFEDYESLIDHPIEIADMQLSHFEIDGTPHTIALTGSVDCDMTRLTNDVVNICQTQKNLFGELPFNKYVFLLTVMDQGYGGLEHRSSTALMCFRRCLPSRSGSHKAQEYQTLLGLFSHEYFHAWNVKRIKPMEFYDADLRVPAFTKQLWAFEGITSYYDDYVLLRAGTIEPSAYLETLSKSLSRFISNQGRHHQTIKASSFDAWTKFYVPTPNSSNALVSYYLKGALCVLLFDLAIRKHSNNQKSMDEIMQKAWESFGRPEKGLAEGVLESWIAEAMGELGKNLVHTCLETTDELPISTWLLDFGVDLKTGPAKEDVSVELGILFDSNPSKLMVAQVPTGSCAQQAGIAPGDELLAINGAKVSKSNLDDRLREYEVGQRVSLHWFREERLLEGTCELQNASSTTVTLSMVEHPTVEQLERRKAWLGA